MNKQNAMQTQIDTRRLKTEQKRTPVSEDNDTHRCWTLWNQKLHKKREGRTEESHEEKVNHKNRKENHENKYNVETHNFCYVPPKRMYFPFPTSRYFSPSLFLSLQTDEDK